MSNVPNRRTIVTNCPEEFRVELGEYLDAIELEVGKAIAALNVKSLSDLINVPDAMPILEDLATKLY